MKIKLPTFISSLIPCLNQVLNSTYLYIWAASEFRVQSLSFYMGMVFSMGFQSATFITVSYGVSECSLYTVPISDATDELGEYSYVCGMHIYQGTAVNIHSGFCEVQEANQGSEEAGSWCSQRQKESRERSEL
jgi:hypothetical protein